MTAPDPLAGHAAIATAYQARIDELQGLLDQSAAHTDDARERQKYAEADATRLRGEKDQLRGELDRERARTKKLRDADATRTSDLRAISNRLAAALRAQPTRREAITTLRTILNDLKEIDHHDAD